MDDGGVNRKLFDFLHEEEGKTWSQDVGLVDFRRRRRRRGGHVDGRRQESQGDLILGNQMGQRTGNGSSCRQTLSESHLRE